MNLFCKVRRRIYPMIESGKGINLVPDYAHSYVLDPETPTEVPDDVAKIILDQAQGIVSKKPFITADVPAKKIKMEDFDVTEPPDEHAEKPVKQETKKSKPEIELPSKENQINSSPIPN